MIKGKLFWCVIVGFVIIWFEFNFLVKCICDNGFIDVYVVFN